MTGAPAATGPARLAVVLKGYPRLSETFIAQEILALEQRGAALEIWSLRRPTDVKRHPIHATIRAPVRYLPEYLYQEPLRVLRGLIAATKHPGFRDVLRVWLRDLRRDPTANRIRRFGQGMVLAREAPDDIGLFYAHFLHTPASTTRYAAALRGLPWGFSAHAKDIWTIEDWEKREKIADAAFGVACTCIGARHLRDLAPAAERIGLVYHGLDLRRFPAPPPARPPRRGDEADEPVRLLSVGRLVEKKGYDDLLDALARLPADLHWRLTHIGGGDLRSKLRARAERLGLSARIDWRGACDQTEVIAAMRAADVFVLPSKIARGGDRDGLPNVLMEAASQNLALVSTRISAIPEFITHGVHGLLVESGDQEALAVALAGVARDPALRENLGSAARARLTADFGMEAGIEALIARIAPYAPFTETG